MEDKKREISYNKRLAVLKIEFLFFSALKVLTIYEVRESKVRGLVDQREILLVVSRLFFYSEQLDQLCVQFNERQSLSKCFRCCCKAQVAKNITTKLKKKPQVHKSIIWKIGSNFGLFDFS